MGDWCKSHQAFTNLKNETTGANRKANYAVLNIHFAAKKKICQIFKGRGVFFLDKPFSW